MNSPVDGDVFGLILAGGRSTRMGRNKFALNFCGESQMQRCIHLMRNICKETYVSLREGMEVPEDAVSLKVPAIFDLFGEIGPLGGILSAQDTHPEKTWLVVAIDMPFLGLRTLRFLLKNRHPENPFTAFHGYYDNNPDPLCAIYEPHSRDILMSCFKEESITCPKTILARSNALLLSPPSPLAIDHISTPEEYEDAVERLDI